MCIIQLIENFPCEDSYQLRQRQGHFIREVLAINEYADAKDCRETTWDHTKERKKEYSQKSAVKEQN